MNMESLHELYSDLSARGIKSDKGDIHSYLPVYEELLSPYRDQRCRLLEIGLFNGDSLRLWERYFPNGTVCGIDLCDQPLGMADLRPLIAEGTHSIFLMSATDPAEVERNFPDARFDVIIEDSSHALSEQVAIYRNFKDKLAPGGVYIIEDVQDIDASRETFEQIDPDRSVEILDRRHIQGRYDDVLVVIKNP